MATSATQGNGSQLLVVGNSSGVSFVDASTPLRRLNYFDGKLLRATDFDVEQSYIRRLVSISNQGLGPGVVYGYDTSLGGGDNIQIGPGLAIDPSGNVLLLQSTITQSIQALIDASRTNTASTTDASGKTVAAAFSDCVGAAAPPPTSVLSVSDVYVIAICTAQALCGQQDVFGKLCEEACVTSTDRPYRLDGLVLRAIPLQLVTPFPTSKVVAIDSDIYLRSKIAHSWYSDEVLKHPPAISRDGLLSNTWCLGAGYENGYCEVPLAVVARAGATTVFLDAWIVRRERMEAPPQRYWQWKMMMRPMDVFLAQILQFQCQLADALSGVVTPGGRGGNPCAAERQTLTDAAALVEKVRASLTARRTTARSAAASPLTVSLAQVSDLRDKLQKVLQTASAPSLATDRMLIRLGFTETPPGAYLPILTGTSVSVNDQVRALLGDGLDLRFCIVRPDFVAHALEEVQHMERISLLEGIDNPSAKPHVDVLVPDGTIAETMADKGLFYEMRLNVLPQNLVLLAVAGAANLGGNKTQGNINTFSANASRAALLARVADTLNTIEFDGAAHSEPTATGGTVFYYAGTTRPFTLVKRAATTTTMTTAVGAVAATDAAKGTINEAAGTAARPNAGVSVGPNPTATTAAGEDRSSIWVALEIADDPTTLARGDTTRVAADVLDLLTFGSQAATTGNTTVSGTISQASAPQAVLLRAIFTGELQVDANEVRPGNQEVREITGVVAGELTLSYRDGTNQNSIPLYLTENVRILQTAGPNGPAFNIQWLQPTPMQPTIAALDVQRKWTAATTAEVLGTMSFASALTNINNLRDSVQPQAAATKLATRETFRAWQTINNAVREPNHPAHEEAIAALRAIGMALGAGKFADLAARRLFPAPPPAAELTIVAAHDWVLFHRRREKQCRVEAPALKVDTRSYALYQTSLSGDETVADMSKLLLSSGPQGERLPALDFVQVVEFDAGIQAVASPWAQVQASWKQDVGLDAGSIVGGVVASQGVAVAEGDRLAQDRLESLVQVIGAAVPIDPSPSYVVLTRVPDSLDVAGQDGIMVIATRQSATNCNDVYAVFSLDTLKQLQLVAQQGGDFQAALKTNQAAPLGAVTFSGSNADATSLQAVQTKWNALTFSAVAGAMVVAATTDAQSSTYPAQANAIVSALGGGLPAPPSIFLTTGTLPSTCPAITIVAGSRGTLRKALLVYGFFDIENGSLTISVPTAPLDFQQDVPQGDALKNFIASLGPNQPVLNVQLTTTQPPDVGAGARLAAIVAALNDANKLLVGGTQAVSPLSSNASTGLQANNVTPGDFSDIVFFSNLPLNP